MYHAPCLPIPCACVASYSHLPLCADPTPLPDFSLAQHIPRNGSNQRRPTNRPQDYLLESRSSLRDNPETAAEPFQPPARIRGGAPSPPMSPPTSNDITNSHGLQGDPSSRDGGPFSGDQTAPSGDRKISPRGDGFGSPSVRSSDDIWNRAGQNGDSSFGESERGRDLASPSEGFPSSKEIHVSPPPRSLTPPLPPTPGSTRPPQSPKGAADVSNGRRTKKVTSR